MLATMPKLTVKLSKAQRRFRRSGARFRGFVGGRGAGKSWVGSYDLICRAKPGRLYMAVAPTYQMLSDATFRTFCSVATSLGVLDWDDVRKTPPSVKLKTGAEILFRSGDDPERLRGPNLSGIWVDEASETERGVYDIGIATLREGGELGWLSATFTPKGKKHWTYDVFGKGEHDTELIHAHTKENPFLPEEFYRVIQRQYGNGTYLERQELGGEFVEEGGNLFLMNWFRDFRWITEAGPGFEGLIVLDSGTNIMRSDISVFAICDPSLGKKHSDDCGIAILGVPSNGRRCFVLHAVQEKIAYEKIVPRLDSLAREWDLDSVLMEANGFQVALAKSARAVLPCVVREVDPEGKSKLARAMRAIELAAAGDLLFPESAPWKASALSELCEWTAAEGEKDNLIDCISYGVREFITRRHNSDDDDSPMGGFAKASGYN